MTPSLSRTALGVLLGASLLLAVPVRADNPPRFEDGQVTAYFQKISGIIDGLLAATKAKDNARIEEWTAKLLATRKEGNALQSKVSPQEDAATAEWGEAQWRRLTDAGWSPSP